MWCLAGELELFYEDLDKIHPDHAAQIAEWLTEKVDALSTKLKPEAKDDEVSSCWVRCRSLFAGSGHFHCSCWVRLFIACRLWALPTSNTMCS